VTDPIVIDDMFKADKMGDEETVAATQAFKEIYDAKCLGLTLTTENGTTIHFRNVCGFIMIATTKNDEACTGCGEVHSGEGSVVTGGRKSVLVRLLANLIDTLPEDLKRAAAVHKMLDNVLGFDTPGIARSFGAGEE